MSCDLLRGSMKLTVDGPSEGRVVVSRELCFTNELQIGGWNQQSLDS